MKVLGISGSHRHANTDDLVKKALEVCRQKNLETEFISLADLNIGYCTNCDACKKEYTCSIKDDVMGILNKMVEANAIIIGSPTYFGGVSGKLKALFDRTLPIRRHGNKLKVKIGAAIAVGGSRNGGQEQVITQIHNWMLIQEITIVGDKKTAHFGGIAVARNTGDALKDEVGVETVVNTALKIVETLERLR